MAENRFTRMLQTARDSKPPEEGEQPREAEVPPPPQPKTIAVPRNGRGRPATGKRSDPDYETTTVFLRKDTKLAAARLLLDDREQDLSDVLEKLLSSWVRRKA
jgi:hypothetical protein